MATPLLPPATTRRYGVVLDLDDESVRQGLGTHYNPAHVLGEIGLTLESYGFRWRQGTVYIGGEGVTAVTCVLAVQELARLPWFAPAVRDVRMVRIEEVTDLMPAVQQAAGE